MRFPGYGSHDCYDELVWESATPGYSLSILFLMNEYLMFYLRQEILKLIGTEEAYRYVNTFGMAPKSPVFGKYNVSDYL